MLASSFLDIAIGIIFIFLLLSLIASTVNEIILSYFNKRGEFLLVGLKTLLNDATGNGLVSEIYNHGQVFELFRGDYDPKKPSNLPSYIPASNFAMAFIGVLFKAPHAILTGLEGEAKEAKETATKTNDPEDQKKAARLRAEATAAEKMIEDAKSALGDLKSDASAAAVADAAVKAAEEAQKAADANPNDAAAVNKAKTLVDEAVTAKKEKVKAEIKASSDRQIQMAAAFEALKTVATALANHGTSEKVGRPLLEMLAQADNDLEKLEKSLESWYDSAMDRVSGWYKYHTQKWLLGIGLALAIVVNADAVRIVAQLSKDSALRQSIVAAAQSTAPPKTGGDVPDPNFKKVEDQFKDLHQLGVPLGWEGEFQDGLTVYSVLAKIFGLFITAVAISMGAPFWFDLLNKFMVIRSTVKPREKSKEEGTKDKSDATLVTG